MAKNRLSREDLEKLIWMSEVKKRLKFELQAVEIYMELWKNEVLTKKGIDTSEPHEINLGTGVIKAVAAEEIKENGIKGD